MKQFFLFILLLVIGLSPTTAQYAQQAGLPGSTAVAAASPLFKGWAAHCQVFRGLMDIANPSLGYVISGDSSLAIGASDGDVVSLGDSGVAVLTFNYPIINGVGPDFAVFENGFLNPANDSQAFLELAFVEVSSDGNRYVRFPATSLTQTSQQDVDPNDYLYASLINNLAGSYVAHYGTPFDLQELADSPGININHITHVRIVDVIGDIGQHASRDNAGRIINDPYPTPFPTGGFDLDAVGVIHQQGGAGVTNVAGSESLIIYPNPAIDKIAIDRKGFVATTLAVNVIDVLGRKSLSNSLPANSNQLVISSLVPGMYYLEISDDSGTKWVGKFLKR